MAALAVAGVVFGLVLPRLAPYGLVWRDLRATSPVWVAVLLGAVVLNLVTFALPWLAVLPGLGAIRAFAMTQASTAFTLVIPGGAPAGMGVSYAILLRQGFSRGPVSRAVALTGIWNQLSTFAFPGVALGLLVADGARNGAIATAALVGVLLFAGAAGGLAAMLASEGLARRFGNGAAAVLTRLSLVIRRPAVDWDGGSAVAFRRESLALLGRSWRLLSVATLVNQLTGYVVFQLALLAAGVTLAQVTVAEAFAAWAVGRLLSSVPITPGGIGFTEVGLTGILIAFGGERTPVVAAVLVYRAISIVPTVLVGAAVSLLALHRSAPGACRVG